MGVVVFAHPEQNLPVRRPAPQVTKLNAISILSGLAVVVVNWLVTVAVRQVGQGRQPVVQQGRV